VTSTKSTKPSILNLLLAIRDAASTKGAQRALLNALALRANPNNDFVCWPSYRMLSRDTCLDEGTLKRAAKRLEDAGLIRRVVRQQQSNRFFVHFDALAAQAEGQREARQLAKLGPRKEGNHFAEPQDNSGNIDLHSDLDDEHDLEQPCDLQSYVAGFLQGLLTPITSVLRAAFTTSSVMTVSSLTWRTRSICRKSLRRSRKFPPVILAMLATACVSVKSAPSSWRPSFCQW
jgi:DNA-binding MarR family transcriptional regulator